MTEKTKRFQNVANKIKAKANTLKNVFGALHLDFADSWLEQFVELKHNLQQYDVSKAGELGEVLQPMYDAQIQCLDEIIDILDSAPADLTREEEGIMLNIVMPLRDSVESFTKMAKNVDTMSKKRNLSKEKEKVGIRPLRDRVEQAIIKSRTTENSL